MDLQKRELSYGRAGFMLQFMLDTTLNDANTYPLKLRDLLVGTFDTSEAPMKLSWLPDVTKRCDPNQVTNLGLKGDGYFYFFSASDQMQPYGYKMMLLTHQVEAQTKQDMQYYIGSMGSSM